MNVDSLTNYSEQKKMHFKAKKRILNYCNI